MKYLIGIILATIAVTANAIPLSFTITDPVGDHTWNTDLISIQMTFDTDTGDYQAYWNASSAAPFTGFVRINANFRNITLDGTTTGTPSDAGYHRPTFRDALNDFMITTPNVTQLMISGTSTELMRWRSGDEIAYVNPGSGGFGISGVRGDYWGPSTITSGLRTVFIGGARQIPEPSPVSLLLLGALLLAGRFGVQQARRR